MNEDRLWLGEKMVEHYDLFHQKHQTIRSGNCINLGTQFQGFFSFPEARGWKLHWSLMYREKWYIFTLWWALCFWSFFLLFFPSNHEKLVFNKIKKEKHNFMYFGNSFPVRSPDLIYFILFSTYDFPSPWN